MKLQQNYFTFPFTKYILIHFSLCLLLLHPEMPIITYSGYPFVTSKDLDDGWAINLLEKAKVEEHDQSNFNILKKKACYFIL